MTRIIDAIKSINPDAKFTVHESGNIDEAEIIWLEGTPEISKADLQVEMDRMNYARKRKAEYPTIEELVVALYDTDDKAAIDAKRAEVKAKYPK